MVRVHVCALQTSYPIEQSALPGGSKRSEPMRGLEQNMLYGVLRKPDVRTASLLAPPSL